MTQTEIQLLSTLLAGFALLALTVLAFALHRSRLGLALLVLSAVATLLAYPLMSRVASDQQDATRDAIEEKYGVDVTAWGSPLGTADLWVVDGEKQVCELDLSDRDDPEMTCTDPEVGRAGALLGP